MMRKYPCLLHERILFDEWSAPDPFGVKLNESLHKFRYDLKNCDQADAYRVLAAAEAFCHFAGHPAGNNSMCKQLRELRNAIKSVERTPQNA